MAHLPDIEDLWPVLVDGFDDEVYVHTLDGTPLHANAACLERLGLTIEQYRALPPWGWVTDISRSAIPERIEQLTAHGRTRFVSLYRLASGGIGSYEVRAVLLRIGDDPIVVAVGRDITGRRRNEIDGALLSAVIDVLGRPVIVQDADGFIEYASEAAARILGYERDDLLRRPMSSLLAEDDAGRLAEEDSRLTDVTDIASFTTFRSADGRHLPLTVLSRTVTAGGHDVILRVLGEATE